MTETADKIQDLMGSYFGPSPGASVNCTSIRSLDLSQLNPATVGNGFSTSRSPLAAVVGVSLSPHELGTGKKKFILQPGSSRFYLGQKVRVSRFNNNMYMIGEVVASKEFDIGCGRTQSEIDVDVVTWAGPISVAVALYSDWNIMVHIPLPPSPSGYMVPRQYTLRADLTSDWGVGADGTEQSILTPIAQKFVDAIEANPLRMQSGIPISEFTNYVMEPHRLDSVVNDWLNATGIPPSPMDWRVLFSLAKWHILNMRAIPVLFDGAAITEMGVSLAKTPEWLAAAPFTGMYNRFEEEFAARILAKGGRL